ncbi:coatomer subunit zeta, partial [Tremellales sp. Uapishka_1]
MSSWDHSVPSTQPRQSRFYIPDRTHPSPESTTVPLTTSLSMTTSDSALPNYQAPRTPTQNLSTGSSLASDRSRDIDVRLEQMDALVEIHRVLYRGEEETGGSKDVKLAEQGKEVKRVLERWFEGDCVYDHPLVRISSRQSLMSHFVLLQLLSTVYLPSFTPSSLIYYSRYAFARVRNRLLGIEDPVDVEAAKGKIALSTWYGLDERKEGEGDERKLGKWWKLWEVSAECKEMGGMECYDGQHLAMIEQIITLYLFPAFTKSSAALADPVSASVASFASLDVSTSSSLLGSLVACLAREFDGLLRWDLRLSTFVEFNEVGKATRIRDTIDVKDLIETVVPFARRFNWVTSRVNGLITSTLGKVAMSIINQSTPSPRQLLQPIKTEFDQLEKALRIEKPVFSDPFVADKALGSAIALPSPAAAPSAKLYMGEEAHGLGLQGMGFMAPDVDSSFGQGPGQFTNWFRHFHFTSDVLLLTDHVHSYHQKLTALASSVMAILLPLQANLSLYSVTALLILDSDGQRVLAKYYSPPHQTALNTGIPHDLGAGPGAPGSGLATLKEQKAFEKTVFEKTRRGGGEFLLPSLGLGYAEHISPRRDSPTASTPLGPLATSNELMLQATLTAFHDAVSLLLRGQIEKRNVLEALDMVLLAADETIDDGIILETDAAAIAARVSRPKADTTDIVINEQTIMSAYSTLRDRVTQRIGAL